MFFKQTCKKKVALEKVQKQNSLFEYNFKDYSYNISSAEVFNKLNYIDFSVSHIIGITFTKSNTHLFVTNISGKLIFYCSTGYLKFKGKERKYRSNMLNNIRRIFLTKFKFLKNKRVALHLKNVGRDLIKIIKKLKDLIFLVTIRNFTALSFNGCRARKVSRKKYKKKLNPRPIITKSKKIIAKYRLKNYKLKVELRERMKFEDEITKSLMRLKKPELDKSIKIL